VDDAHGVITAVETTTGSIAENKMLLAVIDQHEANTGQKVQTAVGDHKYGTIENHVACQQRGIRTHLGDAASRQNNARCKDIFPDTVFSYDAASDTYRCPAGKTLRPRRLHPKRRTKEYMAGKAVCAACSLRGQCTRASYGRTVKRHEHQEHLDRARVQAHSGAARRDRRRRQHLAEASFADAANNHHFKRARWRRLWRQQIQDYLIAGIQNVRLLLSHRLPKPKCVAAVAVSENCFCQELSAPTFFSAISHHPHPPIQQIADRKLKLRPLRGKTGPIATLTTISLWTTPFGQHALCIQQFRRPDGGGE
jgi:hypothetical protein